MIKVLLFLLKTKQNKNQQRFVLVLTKDFMLFVICVLTKDINATIKGRWWKHKEEMRTHTITHSGCIQPAICPAVLLKMKWIVFGFYCTRLTGRRRNNSRTWLGWYLLLPHWDPNEVLLVLFFNIWLLFSYNTQCPHPSTLLTDSTVPFTKPFGWQHHCYWLFLLFKDQEVSFHCLPLRGVVKIFNPQRKTRKLVTDHLPICELMTKEISAFQGTVKGRSVALKSCGGGSCSMNLDCVSAFSTFQAHQSFLRCEWGWIRM